MYSYFIQRIFICIGFLLVQPASSKTQYPHFLLVVNYPKMENPILRFPNLLDLFVIIQIIILYKMLKFFTLFSFMARIPICTISKNPFRFIPFTISLYSTINTTLFQFKLPSMFTILTNKITSEKMHTKPLLFLTHITIYI